MKQLHQNGSALLTTLMLLTICMLLGATTANMTLMQEKASRNARDRLLAFQAAEAALADALLDLHTGRGKRQAFPTMAGECGTQQSAGLCFSDGNALWKTASLSNLSVTYGSVTGHDFPHGAQLLVAEPPRYLIELLQIAENKPSPEQLPLQRYRITAIGLGPQQQQRVILQVIESIHVTPDNTLRPDRRLSWREIADLDL
jgi:type IV pilus assembly protein PilX